VVAVELRVNVGSLFSGIGGIDLGLERAGMRVVWQCEADEYRRDVLRERFGTDCFADVRDVGGERPAGAQAVPAGELDDGRRKAGAGLSVPVDLVCGGFPCQDLSVAGRRKGLAGDRSSLFFEFARICESVRPRFVLVENVPGLLSSQGGRDFGTVVGTLADIGYGVAWRILDSRFFGVPQRRRRVFILGILANPDPRAAAERAGQILAVGTRCPRHLKASGEAGQEVAGTLGGGAGERGWAQDTERMTFIPQTAHSLMSHGGNDKHDPTLQTYVARSLTSPGGSGKGGSYRLDDQENLVAAPLSHGSNPNSNAVGRRREDDVNLVAAFYGGQGAKAGSVAYTEDESLTLKSSESGTNQVPQVFNWQTGGDGRLGYGNQPTALQKSQTVALHDGASVRRLTPTECERLQGFPDGWTQLGGTPDSRRYAALGDAVTVPVAEWIGRRIMLAGGGGEA